MNGKPLNGQVIYVGRFQKKKERQEEMRLFIGFLHNYSLNVQPEESTLIIYMCIFH